MRGIMMTLGSVMLSILILAGCSGTTTTEETTTQAPTETTAAVVETTTEPVTEPEPIKPAFGGTLRIAISPADTLDPLANKIANVDELLKLVYEPLFTLDARLMPTPVLVEGYDHLLDGRALKLVLKEGITFQNGAPLTAEDVAYTIEVLKDAKDVPYRPLIEPIKRVSVADERTLTLYYDEPYAFMLNDLTFPVVSKTYRTSESYDPMVPVGTGPYSFVDYQAMQHLSLKANENWHGGQVMVEGIKAIAMNETQQMESLFDQHLIDLMNPPKFNWLKYSEKEDQQIETYQTTYFDFLGFNMNKALLQDKVLRKAIAYAIDRESLIYNQFIGHATIVDAPIIPGSWFDTKRPLTYAYSPDLSLVNINGDVYKDRDGDGFYDLEEVPGSTNIAPIELVMLVNATSSVRTAVAPKIEAYIEAIGFQVKVDVVDEQTYYDRVNSGDFDLLYGGWQLATKPDYVALFSSDGAQNYFGYQSPEMDLILKSLVSAHDPAIIKERVKEFEALLLEDMPYASLYFLEGAVMRRGNVYGTLNPTGASTFNTMEGLYLDLTGEN